MKFISLTGSKLTILYLKLNAFIFLMITFDVLNLQYFI